MIFDETRDNLTNNESQQQEADAYAETREDGPTWTECQCEHCTVDEAEADHIRDSRHIRLVDEPHEEYEDGANGYDEGSVAESLFGEKHFGGDGDDIEEDDGQPSEYEEWQDYMGGDDYYDHSENECW